MRNIEYECITSFSRCNKCGRTIEKRITKATMRCRNKVVVITTTMNNDVRKFEVKELATS